MITVKLTENYAGFNIEGTFDDFYELYDNINYFIEPEEFPDLLEKDMRLHILGFLYDLRHAYQGSREIRAVDNGLTDEEKSYYGIKKSTKENILYSFNYVIPELLLDAILMNYFIRKNGKTIEKYNTNYNSVITFYSKVIDALSEILTPARVKKVKRLISESNINPRNWLKQWYENVAVDYLSMPKAKRKREMMHIIEAICDGYLFEEFYEMKIAIEKYAEEHYLEVTNIAYGDEYPDDIEW